MPPKGRKEDVGTCADVKLQKEERNGWFDVVKRKKENMRVGKVYPSDRAGKK